MAAAFILAGVGKCNFPIVGRATVLIIVVVLSISRSHERTAEELELVFEELVHLSALSHLSTSIKRELASIIVFEAHAAAGTVCKYSEWWWYMDTLIVCAGSSHHLSGLRQRAAAAGDDDVLLCNVDFSDHFSYSFASYYYYYHFHKVYYDYYYRSEKKQFHNSRMLHSTLSAANSPSLVYSPALYPATYKNITLVGYTVLNKERHGVGWWVVH